MRRAIRAAALAACLAWSPAGRAADEAAATDFIRSVGREMPAVLAGATTTGEKRARLRPFLARVVDVPAVARYCIGPYWDRAAPAQRQEYQSLFVAVLVNTVATWVGGHPLGETGKPEARTSVLMLPPVLHGEEATVPTEVQSQDGTPAHVTWVISMATRPPKILDVNAEGFSLRTTQRSDYVSYLAHHGGDLGALNAVLRQRALAGGGIEGGAR